MYNFFLCRKQRHIASPLHLFEINRIKSNSAVGLPNRTKIYWNYTTLLAFLGKQIFTIQNFVLDAKFHLRNQIHWIFYFSLLLVQFDEQFYSLQVNIKKCALFQLFLYTLLLQSIWFHCIAYIFCKRKERIYTKESNDTK